MVAIFIARSSDACLFYLAVAFITASKNTLCGAYESYVSECVSSSGVDMTIPDSGEKLYDISETPHANIVWRPECTRCPLHFDRQYCIVNNTEERDCLVRRAYLETEESCLMTRNGSRYRDLETFECVYVEFCIFAAENNFTSCNYNCSLEGFNTVNCKNNITGENYMSNCTRSLVNCPKDKDCSVISYEYLHDSFRSIFRDDGECAHEYRQLLSLGKPLYYINQALDDHNGGFGALNALNRPHESCNDLPDGAMVVPSVKAIAIGIIAALAVILVISFSLIKYIQEKGEWKRMEDCDDVYLVGMIRDRPDSPTTAVVNRDADSILPYMTRSQQPSSERNDSLISKTYVGLRTDSSHSNHVKHDSEENQDSGSSFELPCLLLSPPVVEPNLYGEQNGDNDCGISIVYSYTSNKPRMVSFSNNSYSTSDTGLHHNFSNEEHEFRLQRNRERVMQRAEEEERNSDTSFMDEERIDSVKSHDDIFRTMRPGSYCDVFSPLLPGIGDSSSDVFSSLLPDIDSTSRDISNPSHTGNGALPGQIVQAFLEKNSTLLANGSSLNVQIPEIPSRWERGNNTASSGVADNTESESQEPHVNDNNIDQERIHISLADYPYVNFNC